MKTFIATVVAGAALFGAGSASADEFGISGFGGSTNINGQATRQAGAHPDFTTELKIPTAIDPVNGHTTPSGDLKTVKVDLPPGLAGNPTAIPTCGNADLVARSNGGAPNCPIGAQVGLALVYTTDAQIRVPIYNMERPTDLPAAFAFNYAGVVVSLEPRVRSDDYGISVTVPSISQGLVILGSKVTFWGVPADPIHDADRYHPDKFAPGFPGFDTPSPEPRRAFMTAPTSCDGTPAVTRGAADSWQNPGVFSHASFDSDFDGTPFVLDGCERLPFDPSISVQPASHLADASTGLKVDLAVPQNDSPYGLATAHVRKVKVTLPEGMSVSPSSAAGLGACAPSQIKLGSDDAPTCPESSKIGTVSIDTPLLEDPLEGDVILATQDDNPFNSLLALYIVVRGPGVLIKLPGRVDPDPVTGQLTTTFDNTPQLPFNLMHLEFRGGPRAPLATPTACGRYNTHVEITSWASDVPVVRDTPMVIDEGCGTRDLAPSFSAGSAYPLAGESSPFTFALTRGDRSQYLSRIDAELPPGLLADIGSITKCLEAQAAAGTCARGTEIGSTSVLSGPGETPLGLGGRVYLTGPYKDAPFGLSIVVPTAGQAGPFDLGDVVVRARVFVDRTDAHVTVKSDPLPRIIDGFPLRLRQVVMSVDRPDFMLNPTSCDRSTVSGLFESIEGASLTKSVPFRVAGCGDLAFTPKLALALTGKRQVRTGKHPGVRAVVSQPGTGASAIKKAVVRLPRSLALDPDNAQALCEFEDGTQPDLESHCPKGSIVGRAKAVTPLLDKPLSGNVYFVKNVRIDKRTGNRIRTLPMIVVALRGEIAVNLRGEASTTKNGALVNTFARVPDAPITKFNLNIDGGANGILAVTRTAKSKIDLCTRPNSHLANVDLDGHNGRQTDFDTRVKTPCANTKSAKRAKAKHKHKRKR